ncbi:MAG: DEAD/DEAH box helicase [Deltaproteobacteria bacterium]|nr:MAG: DEAD/DEAH box helicase [Deltaproteobacteria bacterium]
MTTFRSLGLAEPLLRALDACGYDTPTPIQAQAIPAQLARRDVLGCAQTGTGKTAAFCLPILQHLSEGLPARNKRSPRPKIRALILTPTRELAAQIGDNLQSYGRHTPLSHHVIYGGVSQRRQVQALERGFDVLVACPGRLLDLHGQGYVDLSAVEHLILDEADRMLDMGFIHDVRRVLRLVPSKRQGLLFSATMPAAIVKLSREILNDPVMVEVTPQATTVEKIQQKVMIVPQADKKRLLRELIHTQDVERAIVFTRTKRGANRLVQQLERGGIEAVAIHGNKSQNARQRALDAFRDGRMAILVATDVASRGIDVDDISHVFNYDLPHEPESYVHRIGRTARAGREGIAIAFCDPDEVKNLRQIERLIGEAIEVDEDHEWHTALPQARRPAPTTQRRHARHSRGRR